MTRPSEFTLAIEPLIDDFMRNLDDMLVRHNGQWAVFAPSGEGRPFRFYDLFIDARSDASVEFGITAPVLIRQVTEDYRIYGRNGKPYVLQELPEID